MGTFIAWGLAIIIGLALLSAAFRELGYGLRGFAVLTRGVMQLFGVRPELAQTRRERVSAVILTVLVMAGVASGIGLFVRWLFT